MVLQSKLNNNKAHIYIYEDRVVKNYHNKLRNVPDYNNLKKIQSLFVEFKLEDSLYKFVEPIKVTENDGIVMKRIPGTSMLDDHKFTVDNYYHAGIWLGYFHRATRREDSVESFGDFTFDNIFICHESKTITGMDPRSLGIKNYYFDILVFFSSAIISFLNRKVLYDMDCVNKFIEGYQKYSTFKYENDTYNRTINDLLQRYKRGPIKDRHGKLKFYVGHFLLSLYLKWHLKRILKQYK